MGAAISENFRTQVTGAIRGVRALDTRLLRGFKGGEHIAMALLRCLTVELFHQFLGLFGARLIFHSASQGVFRSIYSVFVMVFEVEGGRGRVVN